MSDHDVIELLIELVAIDSVNPTLVPGSAGESDVAAFVAQWATKAGLEARIVEHTTGRPSVIVGPPRPGSGKTLLLCAHLDTVGVGGMPNPHTPRVDGDRLYGRGAYDMKAGLAAALIACRDTTRAGLNGQIVVAAVADEEHSSTGVQDLLHHGEVRADAAIVTEPTELEVATAHKGFVWTEIEIIGRAAHGSRPHLGTDAILKAGPILVALDALNRRLGCGRQHLALGAGGLHASLIRGGREESTIPDQCVITVERRTLPGDTVEDVEHDIAELLTACEAADSALQVQMRTTLHRPPLQTEADADIVRTLTGAAETVLGSRVEPVGLSYWADSAFLAQAGIPTVLFGPAGEGAHADVEWVSLASTIACTQTLSVAAARFCH
jgi:acetylornithine deacetylase